TSKVKTVPSGNKVHPSSALKSLFPTLPSNVHVKVAGSNAATCISNLRPTTNRPSGRTTEGESPMKSQPGGAGSGVQVFATGAETAPRFVSVNTPLLYSPPVMT